MLKCLIVDDEKPAVDEMDYLLSQFDDVEVSKTFSDSLSLLSELEKFPHHVLFLDINMPKLSGMIIADHILKKALPIQVVFVTAYDSYAIKAFELNAVDYLLKPITQSRLAQTVAKLKQIQWSNDMEEDNKGMRQVIDDYKEKQKVFSLYKDGVLRPIKFEDISVIFHEDRLTYFVTEEGTFTCKKNLTDIESILTPSFFRSHRTYIINLNHIATIEPWFNNTYMVKMNYYKEEVPISRSKIQPFKERMHIL